jgi:hypothetical protein
MIQGNTTEGKLEAALYHASQGRYVFPCMPGTKEPACSGGFKAATIDPDQIRAWWAANPQANVGWYLHGSGLCAVDLDRGAPTDLDLPVTLTVKTPSGGRHLVYAGKIPCSQSKLAKHIDTRGVGGYTLLPPSIIDERDPKAAKDLTRRGPYTWEDEWSWPVPVPTWVVERLAKPKQEPRRAAPDVVLDHPRRVALVQRLAAVAAPVVEGEGSQLQTIKLANALLDISSPDTVLDAMVEEWAPRCTFTGEDKKTVDEWLRGRVFSLHPGTASRQSDVGCMTDDEVAELCCTLAELEAMAAYVPSEEERNFDPNDIFPPGPFTEAQAQAQALNEGLRKRFAGLWPDEYADVPFPTFWDDTKMIPKKATGATVLVSGQWGSHKTNVTLTWLLDMVAADARVLYAAGEGDIEVGKVRIPAHCTAREIDIKSLRGKLKLCPAVPMLGDQDQVAAFVEEYREFAPNVVVIDTLATATAGEDENSSKFSGHLTDNGAVGIIKRAFKATVLVIAHEGKDASKGARGHSGLMGNVDAGLSVACVEGEARIDVFVNKMRGGRGKFHTYYAVDPASLTDNAVIPVPKLISEDEFKAMSPAAEREAEQEDELIEKVDRALKSLGAHDGSTKAWDPTARSGGATYRELSDMVMQNDGNVPADKKECDKARDAIRKELERRVARSVRLAAYRAGKDSTGAWCWAIPSPQECELV